MRGLKHRIIIMSNDLTELFIIELKSPLNIKLFYDNNFILLYAIFQINYFKKYEKN
jgi:hypothetical protein